MNEWWCENTWGEIAAALRMQYGNKGWVKSFSPSINDEEKKSKIKTKPTQWRSGTGSHYSTPISSRDFHGQEWPWTMTLTQAPALPVERHLLSETETAVDFVCLSSVIVMLVFLSSCSLASSV